MGNDRPDLPLTGGCLCGGVRFEITEPLGAARWCHCSRCRRRTGAPASPQARVVPGSFRIVAGGELVREYVPADGGFLKAFCSTCGSALYGRHPQEAQTLSVRLGAFDGDPGVRPASHQHVASEVHWLPFPDDGLPRHPGPGPTPSP